MFLDNEINTLNTCPCAGWTSRQSRSQKVDKEASQQVAISCDKLRAYRPGMQLHQGPDYADNGCRIIEHCAATILTPAVQKCARTPRRAVGLIAGEGFHHRRAAPQPRIALIVGADGPKGRHHLFGEYLIVIYFTWISSRKSIFILRKAVLWYV